MLKKPSSQFRRLRVPDPFSEQRSYLGLMIHQLKVLLDRAVSLERSGDWSSAITLCEEVFAQSRKAGEIESLVEAVLRIGYSYNDSGDAELAEEYIELAYTIASAYDNHAVAARALNGRAILHHQRGEMERAEDAYAAARELATLAGDLLTVGNTSQNLGILSNIRGSLTEALKHYQQGLACYRQLDHQRGVARVLNNMGMLHTDDGRLDDAEACLIQALDICKRVEDVVTESIVHTNRTELFLARRDLDLARKSCDEAFEISSRLADNRIRAESLKFYGVIYRESGKPHLAEIHLRQAIAVASKYNNPLTEAESKRELALVLRAQERNREALDALNQSHTLFTALQAEQDQADVRSRVTQLHEDFLSIVQRWGESIEAKDRYTRGHCQRVADYACRLAQAVGMPAEDLVWFRMGAFLHDVGKTAVPAEILNKPGSLTDEEREQMEQHTVIGDQMLATSQFPWDIRPMIRWHHERWDGQGYPDRIAGEAIPLPARILRIADVFDALTTTRSYRQPLAVTEAVDMMRKDSGSFDPDLFAVFEDLQQDFLQLASQDGATLTSESPA